MDPTRARAPEIADLATARALITALQEQLATSQHAHSTHRDQSVHAIVITRTTAS